MEHEVQVTEIMDKRNPQQKLIVTNSNISGSEFNNCYAEHLSFKDISLPHLKIQYADLSNCSFEDLNMRHGKISDADLCNLEIAGAQWGGARFRDVGFVKEIPEPLSFTNCNFRNGILTDCTFTNTRLENCKMEGLTINGVRIDELLEIHKGNGAKRLQKASQCLLVADVEKSQAYYRDRLGFRMEGQFVEREGVSFLIKQAENQDRIRPNHTVNGFMDAYIWVDDVDLLYQDFRARGAILESEPVNQSYGMREFLVYDLDGYRFCIGGPLKS